MEGVFISVVDLKAGPLSHVRPLELIPKSVKRFSDKMRVKTKI